MSLQQHQSAQQERRHESATRFVSSKMFSNIFTEGMQLVEETAGYLDGEGRDAARSLERQQALAYASLSMRLTTRLMQIASWLLVMRAVREGEMTYTEAAQDKYRLGKAEAEAASDRVKDVQETPEDIGALPEQLIYLREETHRLYHRILRIDMDLFDRPASTMPVQNDANSQIAALEQAFGPVSKDS